MKLIALKFMGALWMLLLGIGWGAAQEQPADERFALDFGAANFTSCGPGNAQCSQNITNLIQKTVDANVHWVMVEAFWAWSEPNPPTDSPAGPDSYYGPKVKRHHNYDFSGLDQALSGLREKKLNVVLRFFKHPRWAGGQVCDGFQSSCGVIYAPLKQSFKDNLYDLAYNLSKRYSFIKYWIIWNEPNLPEFFSPQPPLDEGSIVNEYMNLVVSPAREAISANIPNAIFVGPDLFTCYNGGDCTQTDPNWGYTHKWLRTWVDSLLRWFPGAFSIFSIHNYSNGVKGAPEMVGELWNKMTELHQERSIWTTEVNYRRGTCDTDEQTLADHLCQHYKSMTWERSFLYALEDSWPTCGFGLLYGWNNRNPYGEKPFLYQAFRAIVAGKYGCKPISYSSDNQLNPDLLKVPDELNADMDGRNMSYVIAPPVVVTPQGQDAPPVLLEPNVPTSVEEPPVVERKTVEELALMDLQGNKVSLNPYRGKLVLLYFWTTRCPPSCRRVTPELIDLHKKYASKGLQILAINMGESLAQATQYVQDKGIPYSTLLYPPNGTPKLLEPLITLETPGVTQTEIAVPTLTLISPSGKALYRQHGELEHQGLLELEQAIQNALGLARIPSKSPSGRSRP